MNLPGVLPGLEKERNCTGPVKVGMLFWRLLDWISFVVVIMRHKLAKNVSLSFCSFEVQHEVTSSHSLSSPISFYPVPFCSSLFPRSPTPFPHSLLNPIQKEFCPPTSTKLAVSLLQSLGEKLRLVLAGATGEKK